MLPLESLSNNTPLLPKVLAGYHPASKIVEVTLDAIKREEATQQPEKRLQPGRFTILFTGDTHSHFDSTIASFISKKPLGGILRRIHYFHEVQRLMPHPVLILDAGDVLQGTPYFEQFKGEPDIEFMNLAGYHLLTIGNHDFDNGWEHLEKLLKKGHFRALCSNIFHKKDQRMILPPYALLQMGETRVAVVGIMGMSAWHSIRPSLRTELQIEEPTKTLNLVLPEIRPHVDLVILLSHSGIKEDRVLAQHSMVDIVIGGHSHTLMKHHENMEGVPIFHAFRNGQLVGRLDLVAKRRAFAIRSSVEFLDERYDEVNETTACTLLKTYKENLGNALKRVLGFCQHPLSIEGKIHGLIPLGAWLAEILRFSCAADVGFINSGTIKVGIEKGPITLEHLHQVLPHLDALYVATISGSLLMDLMKKGFTRWGFDRTFQYSGIHVKDLKDQGLSITIQGVPLERETRYVVSAPFFFFEREFLDDKHKFLPEVSDHVFSLEEKEKDMRQPIIKCIMGEGFMPWIAPLPKSH